MEQVADLRFALNALLSKRYASFRTEDIAITWRKTRQEKYPFSRLLELCTDAPEVPRAINKAPRSRKSSNNKQSFHGTGVASEAYIPHQPTRLILLTPVHVGSLEANVNTIL